MEVAHTCIKREALGQKKRTLILKMTSRRACLVREPLDLTLWGPGV